MAIPTLIFLNVNTTNPNRVDVKECSVFERFDGGVPNQLAGLSRDISNSPRAAE
jgi:hypothetical protein